MKTEEITILDKPNNDLKLLSANRLTNPAHVREIMQSMERGEWVPPIFVKDNYIVDGSIVIKRSVHYVLFIPVAVMN
jgi:hypothetical protein